MKSKLFLKKCVPLILFISIVNGVAVYIGFKIDSPIVYSLSIVLEIYFIAEVIILHKKLKKIDKNLFP